MTRDGIRAVALAAIMVVSMVAVGAGFAGSAVAQDGGTTYEVGQGNATDFQTIQEALSSDALSPGDTIELVDETYSPSEVLSVDTAGVEIVGVGDTTIESESTGYGIRVTAADVRLSNLEITGSGSYAIKVSGADVSEGRLDGFTIEDVDVSDSGRTGLDLNAVTNATIDSVTVSDTVSGNGVAFTDVTDTEVTGVTTTNNSWGGVAIYAAGALSDQLGDDVGSYGIEFDGDLDADEPLPLYEQASSDDLIGDIDYPGNIQYRVAANTSATLPDGNVANQFEWFYTSESAAVDAAVATNNGTGTDAAVVSELGGQFVVDGNLSVQAAINAAESGATIDVYPGTYEEIAKNRDAYGTTNQPYSFGLYVGTDDLTIRGVTAEGDPITETENVQAEIVSTTSVNFGTNGPFIAADDTTIQGLELTPNPDASPNKNVEVTGDNLSLESNVINGDIGSVYFATGDVQSLSVVGNQITAGLSFNNGVGNETGAESRVVEDNEIGLISFAGAQPDVNWRNYPVGPVTIEDNTIRGHSFVLEYEDEEGNTQTYVYEGVFSRVGSVTEVTEFPELFDENTVLRGSYIENDTEPTGVENLGTESSPAYEIAYSAQESINATTSGDTVVLANGTYEENLTLDTANVTLRGAGGSVVDGRIDITEDAVAVEDLTVRHGAPSGSGEVEGIFVGDANGFGNTDAEVRIHNVTVEDIHPHRTEKTLEAIHVKQYGGTVDGVVISETTLRNVTQPEAGANAIKIQAGVSDVTVTGSTLTDIEGSWAYGIAATPSGSEDGVPTDVSLTSNAITNVSAIDYDGVGVGIDGSGDSFADPTEIELSRNSFANNGIAVLNKNPDERLDATLNWWGDATGPTESDTIVGNVTYDPFLTVEPDEVDAESLDETTQFGHDLVVPADGTPHSVAFPAPVEGNVSEVFGEFNGTVFAYDGDGWESGSEIADEEVGALDAFTVKVDEGEEDLRIAFEYTASDAQYPTSADLDEGWNFVGAPESGDSDEAFEVTTTNIATVSHINAGAGSQPYGVTATPPFATSPEKVSPFQGYWVFVTDDGELGATVPVGPTQSNEEAAVTGS